MNYCIETGISKGNFAFYGTNSYKPSIDYFFEIFPHPYHA